jgi:hypothetical protein
VPRTYQEFASENLAGFGWKLEPGDIPDVETSFRVVQAIGNWWDELDDTTRNVVRASDISAGLAAAGFLNEWPRLQDCFAGNPFGTFSATWNDIAAALERAKHAVDEQPQGLPEGTGIGDVTGGS